MTETDRRDQAGDTGEGSAGRGGTSGSGGIGPTNMAVSASEAGSLSADRGPTVADTGGEPLSDDATADGDDTTLLEDEGGESIGDVYRGG